MMTFLDALLDCSNIKSDVNAFREAFQEGIIAVVTVFRVCRSLSGVTHFGVGVMG